MAKLDNLLTTDDQAFKHVLRQGSPVLVYFYDGNEKTDKPLENALQSVAKKNRDALLIAKVDIAANVQTHQRYGTPTAPALVTLTKGFLGHKVKSTAAEIRPKDVRAHVDYLLDQGPDPCEAIEEETAMTPAKNSDTKEVTDRTFKRDVLKAKTPVLVDFWAPWCGPCVALAPYMEAIASEYKGRVRIAKLNVDHNPAAKMTFQVESIPTLIMFNNGEVIERRTGANKQTIRDMLEEALLTS